MPRSAPELVRAMEIDRASLTTLWITSLVLPYLVFAIHNSFRRRWLTFFRALIAVGVGWLFLIAYATAADAINRVLASTPAEIEALNNGDGAKFAFAAVLGWVLPTIIVGASWVIHGLVVPKITLTLHSKRTAQKRAAAEFERSKLYKNSSGENRDDP